ncbi:MAG: hypothetical protein AB2651_22050 [Candidatus Thiodiazotropha sp.]
METSEIIAICAAIIALSATGVSIWQGYLNRRHFRLSVKPHLTVHWKNFSDEPVSFTLTNNGLGPAVIKSFILEVEGNLFEKEKTAIYHAALGELGLSGVYDVDTYAPTKGEAYAVGSSLPLLTFTNSTEIYDQLFIALPKLKFKITYTSMYDEEEYQYYGNC